MAYFFLGNGSCCFYVVPGRFYFAAPVRFLFHPGRPAADYRGFFFNIGPVINRPQLFGDLGEPSYSINLAHEPNCYPARVGPPCRRLPDPAYLEPHSVLGHKGLAMQIIVDWCWIISFAALAFAWFLEHNCYHCESCYLVRRSLKLKCSQCSAAQEFAKS